MPFSAEAALFFALATSFTVGLFWLAAIADLLDPVPPERRAGVLFRLRVLAALAVLHPVFALAACDAARMVEAHTPGVSRSALAGVRRLAGVCTVVWASVAGAGVLVS